jgi:hypothetical protein
METEDHPSILVVDFVILVTWVWNCIPKVADPIK